MGSPLRVLRASARLGTVALADLLVPRRCGVCGAFGPFLCAICAAALPTLMAGWCGTCDMPIEAGDLPAGAALSGCACAGGDPADASVGVLAALCSFDGGARRLVHRLKYERLSALAGPMGAAMAEQMRHLVLAPDVIVPVPLHPRRQRERGFNQAALLARALGSTWGVPVREDALRRVRATHPQARTASEAERAANVANAFGRARGVTGMRVLLIDDVATTGATLRECARPLRTAGAIAVDALVFARQT